MTRKLLALSLLAAAVASPALAQDDEPQVTYKAETHIDFTALELEGVLAGPELIMLDEYERPGFTPLITLRADFNAEMDASVNEVK